MREILAILVPFFAIVAIGYAAGRFRLVWQSGLNGLNAYLWYFALPVMLFRGVASRDFAELADPRLAFVHGIAGRYVRDVGVYSTAILTSTVISVLSLTLVVWLVTQGA